MGAGLYCIETIDFSQSRTAQEKQVLKELCLVQIIVYGKGTNNETLALFDYVLNERKYENLSIYRNENLENKGIEMGS